MPPKKRSSPKGVGGSEHWLRPEESVRSRPWAYEELLFGSSRHREQAKELDAVVGELEQERAELVHLHEELDDHLARIAHLERRLNELTPADSRAEPQLVSRPVLPRMGASTVGPQNPRPTSDQRSYSLARCEGFQVDSPAGPVGFVEGLRFVSRIDRPDLLEVRGGRRGREVLIIPIEDVEEVDIAEERVLVRSAPDLSGDLLSELVDRLRRALRFDQAAS